MKVFILFITIFIISTHCLSWMPPLFKTDCNFTRFDALRCVLKHGDTNSDGKLSKKEVETALDKLVPGWIKKLSWFTGVTVEQVMHDCDFDKDGIITPKDWELDGKQKEPKCMPEKKQLCTFQWFCQKNN